MWLFLHYRQGWGVRWKLLQHGGASEYPDSSEKTFWRLVKDNLHREQCNMGKKKKIYVSNPVLMIEQSVIPGKQANLKEGKERAYKTSRFFFLSFYTQNREWIDFMILEGFSPMNKDVFPQLFTAGWQPLDTAVRTRARNGAARTEWWMGIVDREGPGERCQLKQDGTAPGSQHKDLIWGLVLLCRGGLMWHPRIEQQLATSATAPPLLQLSNTCCPHQFFWFLLPLHFLTAAVCFFLMKSLTGASKGRCIGVRKRREWCLSVFQVKIADTHICIRTGKAKQRGKSIALVKTHFQIRMKFVISRAPQMSLFQSWSLNVSLAESQSTRGEQDFQMPPNPSPCQTAPFTGDSPAGRNARSFLWFGVVFGLEKFNGQNVFSWMSLSCPWHSASLRISQMSRADPKLSLSSSPALQ